MATAFQAQVTRAWSCEGVFQRFPGLKIVLIEGGFAWLAPLMWRLDRAWKQLRAEVAARSTGCRPRSSASTSGVTTQPMEEPPRRQDCAVSCSSSSA